MERLENESFEKSQLVFPGREPIKQWKVMADHVVCPLIGVILLLINTQKIKGSTTPWLYAAYFAGEVVACLLLSFMITSPPLKYTLYSFSIAMFVSALASLLIAFAF